MKNALLLGLLLLIGSISANAQKVNVGADPAVDATKYKTYGWAKGQTSSNPLIDQLIMSTVDAQLQSKGLTKVETNPELTIVAFGSIDHDLVVSNPSWAPNLNSLNTGIYAAPSSVPITKGTLVIDITDTLTKNSVWRGTATDTLKNGPTGNQAKDAKTVEKPIRNSVEKMFKQYPHPNRK